MKEKLELVEQKRAELLKGGGDKVIARQHERKKLTARERVEKFLDPDTFNEFDLWIKPRKTGFEDLDNKFIPGDAIITGRGRVEGRPVLLFSQDFTVQAGTIASFHARKIAKAIGRALKMRVPFIDICDSGGARIHDWMTIDFRNTLFTTFNLCPIASGVIPQITLLMGPSAAGTAYYPIMTDFIFMVKGTSSMYISSPPIIKAVTFVDTTIDEIGSAKVHAEVSGCCDLVAEDDEDCLNKARELLSYLPQNNGEMPPIVDTGDDPKRREEALLEIVPTELQKPYDMLKVIKLIVDKGKFFEIKPTYARNIITGFARMAGRTVGIVANQPMFLGGAIDINASDKEARFIRFCDCFNIPLVFLVDNPAYLPGVEQERGGIIRHGAKVLFAISEATVPKLVVYIRKAYGGGQSAMCVEPMGADLLLAWPTAQLGLLGVDAAVSVIFRKEIEAAADPEEMRKEKMKEYKERFGESPFHEASVGWIEEIIDPRDTRPLLIQALKDYEGKKEERPWKKHSNIPL
jgi:acetyl-CoA carboxylase carboxyltransferase component